MEVIEKRLMIFHINEKPEEDGSFSLLPAHKFEAGIDYIMKKCELKSSFYEYMTSVYKRVVSKYGHIRGMTIVVEPITGIIGYSLCSGNDSYSKEYGRLKAVNRLCDKIPDSKRKKRLFIKNNLSLLGPNECPKVPVVDRKDIRQKLRELETKFGYPKN